MSRTPTRQFDEYASDYESLHRESIRTSGEEPDYFARYQVGHLARVLPGARPLESILDFGRGIVGMLGHVTQAFPEASVHGADVSEASLEIAKAKNPRAHFASNLDATIPLGDGSADLAYATCVFHHTPPAERPRWAKELKRALRRDGHLFIFKRNPLNPLTRKVVRDCPFDADADAILPPAAESLPLLADAGFGYKRLEYAAPFPKALKSLRPFERLIGFLPFGAQYALHGQATA